MIEHQRLVANCCRKRLSRLLPFVFQNISVVKNSLLPDELRRIHRVAICRCGPFGPQNLCHY